MSASRPKRVHPSGRLSFRKNVRLPKTDDLPLVVVRDAAPSWDTLVPGGRHGSIEIEIGCGKGAFLVAAAERRPDVFFLGVEAGTDYARYCAGRVQRRGIENAMLVADDARLLLADTVPTHSIDRIHIYYPDPWPKRRHRKRRIIDHEFTLLADRCLAPGGELLVATDNTRYFGEMLAVLGTSALLSRTVEQEAHYGDETPGLAFGPTNFSEKYRIEERPRHRAVYTTTRHAAPRTMSDMNEASDRIRLGRVEDIPEDGGLAVEAGGLELALFRHGDSVACLEDSCPHRGAGLSEGRVRDGEVVCPWHGWRFGLADGECSTLPGSMPAKTFPIWIENGVVFLQREERPTDDRA